jgi:hypothetical protein
MSIDLARTEKAKVNEIVMRAVGEALHNAFPIITRDGMLLASDACITLAFTYALQCISQTPESPTYEDIEKVKGLIINMVVSVKPIREAILT